MATLSYSEVKTQLDAVAARIDQDRQVVKKAVSNAGVASADLAAIPADYAALVSTIQGYGATPANAAEALAVAELGKLQAEFSALKSTADGIAATAV